MSFKEGMIDMSILQFNKGCGSNGNLEISENRPALTVGGGTMLAAAKEQDRGESRGIS